MTRAAARKRDLHPSSRRTICTMSCPRIRRPSCRVPWRPCSRHSHRWRSCRIGPCTSWPRMVHCSLQTHPWQRTPAATSRCCGREAETVSGSRSYCVHFAGRQKVQKLPGERCVHDNAQKESGSICTRSLLTCIKWIGPPDGKRRIAAAAVGVQVFS